ncbi:MAG: response regulator, partial [Planctomycetes bacterium]|nr:response regulator [Planctomycetota bacterium]
MRLPHATSSWRSDTVTPPSTNWATTPTPNLRSQRRADGRRQRVLLVDDEPDVLRGLCQILER